MPKSATLVPPIACICGAVAVLAASYVQLAPVQIAGTAVAALLLAAGLFLYVWASMRREELEAVASLPGALDEIRKAGKEYYRNTAAIQDNSQLVQQLREELPQRVEEMLPLRKPLEDLLIEQRQQGMMLREELEGWQKSVVRFWEYLERSLSLDNLHPVQSETYDKMARDLARELRPLGFEVIAPKPGEPFDEIFHEWKGSEVSEIAKDHLVRVEGFGFRIGARCLKPAQVVVSEGAVIKAEDGALLLQPQPVLDPEGDLAGSAAEA